MIHTGCNIQGLYKQTKQTNTNVFLMPVNISTCILVFVCLFVCIGPGYCIQCGSSNPLGFIGFSLKPKVLGVCNAPSTNGSYGYIGIGGGNLLTLPTPVVKPNTTPAVI